MTGNSRPLGHFTPSNNKMEIFQQHGTEFNQILPQRSMNTETHMCCTFKRHTMIDLAFIDAARLQSKAVTLHNLKVLIVQ